MNFSLVSETDFACLALFKQCVTGNSIRLGFFGAFCSDRKRHTQLIQD
ncbi:hypothetical protein [Nostoc sp. UIC 10630]|nr:hypothetical protein [Nostoc sp. UIC 10630]NEU81049.1 hypothetical protein [Nostoc sp. UIC 10630]